MSTIPEFPGAVPQIPVSDIDAATRYYRDCLMFDVDWIADDISMAGISRDNCRIFLAGPAFRGDEPLIPVVTWLNLQSIEEVNDLHDALRARGADVVSPPESKPWGLHEFTVADPDGNRFRTFYDFATPERERLASA